MKTSIRFASLLALVAAANFLTGCASEPKTAAAGAEKEEYVTVMTTGSNIPVRIKKSDIAAGKVPKGVIADSVDKDEFNRNLRPGRAVESGR